MISKIGNYLKCNYFWDGDGIENVTLRPWKFSDFCSRHTVGVAGDAIIFHILVIAFMGRKSVKYTYICKKFPVVMNQRVCAK